LSNIFENRIFKQIIFLRFIIAAITTLFFANPVFSNGDTTGMSIITKAYTPLEKTIFYKLGDKNVPIKIIQYGDVKDLLYINVHDNEPTSVEAAKTILEKTGGTLIRIENKMKRNISFRLQNQTYTIDPNRIFSRTGIVQTLKLSGRISDKAIDEVEKFGKRLLQLIPEDVRCVIALHNNTNGGYSVLSYLPGNDRQNDARYVYADSLQDGDDIALTTDSILYQKMADYRYNTILQDNENAYKDGSLSIYCGEKNISYINIETEHGRLVQHKEMLEKLVQVLITQKNKSLAEARDSK
jgi:hypothetical protein